MAISLFCGFSWDKYICHKLKKPLNRFKPTEVLKDSQNPIKNCLSLNSSINYVIYYFILMLVLTINSLPGFL